MPVTNYIWDVENDSYLAETDENGNTTAVYTNEPETFGHVISQRRGNATSYFHFDALGSTRQLTNDAAVVTDTYLYDSFGVMLSLIGGSTNNLRHVGEIGYYWDLELATTYVRSRPYLPAIARWGCLDPFHYLHWQSNPYSYVHNSPLLLRDPLGLFIVKPDNPPEGTTTSSKTCGSKCCTVEDIWNKLGLTGSNWESTFNLQAGGEMTHKFIFVQRVTIEFYMGAQCGDCKCTPDECCACADQWVHGTMQFVEGFNPWLEDVKGKLKPRPANNPRPVIDSHGNPWKAWSILEHLCHSIQPCCYWNFWYYKKKELKAGAKPDIADLARELNWRNTFKLYKSAECGTCGEGRYSDDDIAEDLGYPLSHTDLSTLVYPPKNNQPQEAVKEIEIYMDHLKCSPTVEFKMRVKGYKAEKGGGGGF